MKKVFLTLTMLLFAFTGTMKAQSAMPNRDMQTLIEEGFEGGVMPEGWTQTGNGNWTVGTGDYSSSTGAATGTYNAKCLHSSTGNNTYLITPAMDLSNATSATISCKYVNRSWAGDIDGFGVYYRVDGGAWNELFYTSSAHSTWTATGDIELTDFAANYQIGFRMKDSYGYGVGLDDVVVTADIAAGGGALTTTPDVLDLGARPNGAWMAPYVFTINGTGTTVNALDFSGNYFTYNAQLPATLTATRPLEVTVTTGEAEEGDVNSTLTVLYGSNRDAQQFNITAYAYDPVPGDVWENAISVDMEPQTTVTETLPDGIYKNYELPVETDNQDAVYQLTFDEDVLFYAGSEYGDVVLYPEGFEGVGGPAADNNYVYNGPEIGPGPMNMWFSYNYTGTNTFYGTSAGGGTIFGYRITPAMLQELGLGNCAITTVETAAREGSYYDLIILKGGDTPDLNNMVYYQAFDNYEPFYFFDVNLDEPQFLGDDENIWVMFYSDSPYAAYCGKQPIDAANSKIWYTTDLSTWYSSTTYTPVIYTRFLELPTGREVTVNLADMSIRESKPATGELAEANGDVMGISKAQRHNAMRGNRDQQTLIEQGFEDGMAGWTMYNCNASTGINNGGANNGNYCFRFRWTSDYPQYLISPELDDNNGGTVTFYAKQESSTYPESYKLGYSTTTNDVSAFTFGSEVTDLTSLYAEKSFDFPAGTKYICIACTSDDMYYMYVDDITITADINSTPEPPTPGDEPWAPNFTVAENMNGMYVPAGTYYLVVANDNATDVNMAYEAVPAPEQAVIYAPYAGEENVTAPYLAEWHLGDYTVEMQVLVGTQYPPQTALIDWTSELVESAFITDLEPNKNYFMQVNARNAAGTTYGEVIGFSTPIDPVEGFEVADDELYPGDAAVFTWEANSRALRGYNLYMDGVLVNEAPIVGTTYSVEGLEYNMQGYDFQITAVYNAGESELSEPVTVFMTGYGNVSGHVYDIDEEHPIAGATVMYIGADEYEEMSEAYFVTDEEGFYSGEILAGIYAYGIATEGFDPQTGAGVTEVEYMDELEDLDIITHEFYYPLSQITATEEEDDVLVEWSWTPAELIIDFETGDFSQFEFTQPAQYPWAITTTNAHEGTYAIKSTCEGVASGLSQIEATVDVPYDGKMGFWVKVSSEANYDKFHFYIDGIEQGSAISGTQAYAYKEYDVTEGTHTYKWTYQKDSSVNSNDDCAYVDDITMYRYVAPLPPVVGATVYDFEDQTMMGWTSIDADNDGYGWVSSGNPGQYHNASVTLAGTGHNASQGYVLSGSYTNSGGMALNPDNYLVSPAQIAAEDGAQIQFYACAQDANYAAEHFGVAVSTTTATASAFTTIQEWTLTAKGQQGPYEDAAVEVRGTRAQGAWYIYTVDLSSYAGQDIWVAIRHFNCSDEFILNVDDITLATGGSKTENRGNRSLMSYNLYRRNNIDEESVADPELIAEGLNADVYEYIDNEWPNLPFGEYQWGIQATYEGYASVDRNRETATFGFENGLEGWTGIVINADGGEWIHSNNNLGGYDYTELAHTGSGFAMCYSYVDYDGPYDTKAYMVSPQKYAVDANSTITFWADNANDSYPENFSVCVSTAANPTGDSDFIEVWNGGAKGTGVAEKAAVRHQNNRYQNWRSHEISLAAYAGQEIWIAFLDENYDAYEIWIDDVTITYAGSAPVPPTPGPTGTGLSEILWSNMIEKDMMSNVTFNLSLNNGQSPAGAEITLTSADDEAEEFVMDETGTMTVEIRKGTYALAIELDGYTPIAVENLVINEDEQEFTYMLEEIIAEVANLYVSPTGWAMWEGGTAGGNTPAPGPTPGALSSFTEGFENGLSEGWNVVDANNDGWTWCLTSAIPSTWTYYATIAIDWYRTGTNAICSGSYINGVGALTPDEYLVTPMVNIQSGSTLSFWAAATDSNYPADHFGVFVSDDATNWTSVQEWTLTGKGEANTVGGPASRNGKGAKLGTWHNFSVDLSAYAGDKYLAIRHFNCNDQYIMCIDDIEFGVINKGNRAPLSYKVKLDGQFVGETEYPYFQHDVEGMEAGSTHVTAVAPVYATGMPQNAQGETLWQEYEWTYTPCDEYVGVSSHSATVNGNNVTLNWTLGDSPLPPTPPTPGQGQWYYYDNGSNDNNIGAGGAFYWAIMFPAGSYTGDYVTKVATYDAGNAGYAFTGTATIYQGGTTAPGTAVGTVNVATTGATADFIEYEFAEPVAIDATQNLWVVFYNATSSSYCATAYAESGAGDANARWVSLDGSSWMDLATAGISGYGWMLRVYVAEGAKGEVHEITVPTQTCNNAGVLSAVPATRGRSVIYEPHFVTDPGAMANGADASWIKDNQNTLGPGAQMANGNIVADDFTLDATTTITEIEVYGYQTGSTTTSTFTGLYAVIYDGNPMNGGQIVWGDMNTNIMTSTAFTNCYRGNGTPTATTRPIMSVTASNLNIELPAGTYYLAWYMNGSGSSGPWAQPEALPNVGNTGNGIQYLGSNAAWQNLLDSGTNEPMGVAFKLVGEGGNPNPNPNPGGNGDIIGVYIFRDGELIAQKGANETTYVDENVEGGYHSYCVRVVYDDYAMSCPACDEVHIQYEGVAEDNIVNAIYPNPTSSKVTIEAKDMNHITVVSTLGQVVYDADVNADQIELNLGQYNAGLYLVRVSTANGVSVKRVTVVK